MHNINDFENTFLATYNQQASTANETLLLIWYKCSVCYKILGNEFFGLAGMIIYVYCYGLSPAIFIKLFEVAVGLLTFLLNATNGCSLQIDTIILHHDN